MHSSVIRICTPGVVFAFGWVEPHLLITCSILGQRVNDHQTKYRRCHLCRCICSMQYWHGMYWWLSRCTDQWSSYLVPDHRFLDKGFDKGSFMICHVRLEERSSPQSYTANVSLQWSTKAPKKHLDQLDVTGTEGQTCRTALFRRNATTVDSNRNQPRDLSFL